MNFLIIDLNLQELGQQIFLVSQVSNLQELILAIFKSQAKIVELIQVRINLAILVRIFIQQILECQKFQNFQNVRNFRMLEMLEFLECQKFQNFQNVIIAM